jgi:hypothetical protein
MRVAVCISGQPRNARDTFPYIYNHIVIPNNADVFIHTYFDPENLVMEKTHIGRGDCQLDAKVIDEIIHNYKPVRYLVEKPKAFAKPNIIVPENRIRMSKELNPCDDWDVEQHKKHVLKNMMSMYYSIFKANELKENYANEQGFVYDYVIRVRFDLVPMMPIQCASLDPNVLYYHDLGQPENQPCDWINIGSNMVMNIYSSVYFHLEYLNSYMFYSKADRLINTVEGQGGGGFNEYLTRDILSLHKIPVRGLNLQCILHPKN